MIVSYLTTYDALDVHSWSGTGFYIPKSLELHGAKIDYVGKLKFRYENFFKLKQAAYGLLGKQYLRNREPFVAKEFARQALERVNPSADIILSPDSTLIAHLHTDKPKAIYTDATLASMIDYYKYFTNLCSESIRKANDLEQKALDNADLIIYSSDWAAESAINDYNISPDKITVIPFGANITSSLSPDDVSRIINEKEQNKCILLFLAVEWERKGGDVVYSTAKLLNEMGLPTELHIVGIKDIPIKPLPKFVKNHGYISKSTLEGRLYLEKIFKDSHFMFVPSKADCTPIVFSEANSYGLPVISTKTGGIPSIIKDGSNGITFDAASSENEYATYIYRLFNNKNDYVKLSSSAFQHYKDILNWDVTGKKLVELFSLTNNR